MAMTPVDRLVTAFSGTHPVTGQPRTAASVMGILQDLLDAGWFTFQRLIGILGEPVEGAASSADDVIVTATATFNVGDPVRFTTTGTMPSPLVAGTVYYVKTVYDTEHFDVSATSGGSLINLTTDGTGTLFVWRVVDAASLLWSPVSGVLPAGTLRDQITFLRDTFARINAANAWSAAQTFDAAVTINTNISLDQAILSGGRHTWRRGTITDASQTIDVTYDVYRCAVPTANRILTLRSSTAPAPVGAEQITVYRPPTGAFTYDIQREGGTSIVVLGSAAYASATFIWTGTTWELLRTAGTVTVNNPV